MLPMAEMMAEYLPALAQGNVVIDTTFTGKTEKTYKVRGRILGGGQVKASVH